MDETTKSPEKSKNGPEKVRIQQKGSVYRHYSSLGPEVRNVKFCIGPTEYYGRSFPRIHLAALQCNKGGLKLPLNTILIIIPIGLYCF